MEKWINGRCIYEKKITAQHGACYHGLSQEIEQAGRIPTIIASVHIWVIGVLGHDVDMMIDAERLQHAEMK